MTDEKICHLATMVREKYGLDFAPDRWSDLRRAIENFHGANDKFCSAGECLEYIISPIAVRKDLELFINSLTIGETYFFRDPHALDVLERDIIKKENGQGSGINGALRIWSMACATGEEPYTLAMICRRSNVSSEIFGTDIDSRALIKAHEGRYRKWSFRSESTVFRDIYFKESGSNSYLIDQSIKDMVELSRFNLIGDELPASLMEMDVILCRNVLMYFSGKGVNMVLDKIWNSLNSGGWLVVTPSESALVTSHGKFEPVNFGAVLFFRKNEKFTPVRVNFSEGALLKDQKDYSLEPLIDQPDFLESDFDAAGVSSELLEGDNSVSYSYCEYEPHNTTEEDASGVSGTGNIVDDAEVLRAKGDNAGALTLLKNALETTLSRSCKAEVLYAIAKINADSGLLDKAVLWCELSIQMDRLAPQTHFLLGQIRMQQGNTKEAIAEVRNAVFLDSGFIMAHVVLGNIYMSCNDSAAALRHFRISLQELGKMESDEVVLYSDGTTAGRLREMVKLVQSNLV